MNAPAGMDSLTPATPQLGAGAPVHAVKISLRDPDVIASGLARNQALFVAGYALQQGFAEKMRGTADDLGRYHAVGLYVSAQRRYMIIVTSILVAAAVIASTLLSRLVARRISHPITELAHATELVAKGDLEHRVVVPARDEVLSLVNGFNKMTQELRENRTNLIAMAKREAEVARDFEIARQVQESLFPTALPLIPGWEFATTCRTAEVVGGDYHDVFEVAPGKVLFAIGDVMGKSVGASLTMASVHAVIRSAGATLGSETALPRLVEELNRYLVSSHTREMFVTLFLGLIDTSKGKIWYVNCGHPPGLLVRALNGAPERLEAGGLVLGVVDTAAFEVGEARMDAGNTLVLVSDGVTEAMNPREHLYGDERLAFTVGNGHDLGAMENMQRILDSVDDFAEGAKQHDDISIVVLRRAV
jgi:sigma-B regulation protein RsbU (phosphoserine phosphatase)